MSARQNIIPIFIPHLGCPHDCVFCNQKRISGSLLPATAQDVEREINEALERLPDGSRAQLAFYGGSFTAIPPEEQEALLAAAEPFLKAGLINGIRLSTRPDAIDKLTLARLECFGVDTIELGAQSMDNEVLRLSGRGHLAEDTERSARMIKSAGFRLVLQMMTGLPGSTPEKDIETAKRLIALEPDNVRIYPTVIIKDTALYDLWQRGEYAEHTVEDATEVCSEIVPLFERAGIGIIRLGLNPTEELSAGSAAGGAYHPALGELVQGRILLKKARTLLADVSGTALTLGVNKSQVSPMVGQRRCNITELCREFGFKSVKVVPADVKKGEIIVTNIAK